MHDMVRQTVTTRKPFDTSGPVLTLRHDGSTFCVMTSAHEHRSDEDFMSPVEVQAALGVSRRTLWRYRKDGRLTPSHHTPTGHARFRRADVEALRAYVIARASWAANAGPSLTRA